jgi:hypothetical protein
MRFSGIATVVDARANLVKYHKLTAAHKSYLDTPEMPIQDMAMGNKLARVRTESAGNYIVLLKIMRNGRGQLPCGSRQGLGQRDPAVRNTRADGQLTS